MRYKKLRMFGIIFIITGFIFLLSSLKITGFVTLENFEINGSFLFGIVFIIGGILIITLDQRKVVSRIRDNGLERFAEEAGKNEKAQRDIDHLIYELRKGNESPGIGSKNLFGDIYYLRGRNGGRVFYRKVGERYEILAKASKSNEQKAIGYLRRKYH